MEKSQLFKFHFEKRPEASKKEDATKNAKTLQINTFLTKRLERNNNQHQERLDQKHDEVANQYFFERKIEEETAGSNNEDSTEGLAIRYNLARGKHPVARSGATTA